MADFHQEELITTLHGLYEAFDRETYLVHMEEKLEEYARHSRISLLLPSLYTEIKNPPVLDNIINEISKVKYLKNIVVALGGAPDEAQFREARTYFSRLTTPEREVKVVWVDGPRIQDIFQQIQARAINTGVQGKGQSVWITLGYLFSKEESDIIALHDCDIVTYDRILLARLIEPIASLSTDFEFCKGFYVRISPVEKVMKGRVTRLFVTPFVDAMARLMRQRGFYEMERFFRYHRAFLYPLAGEFSFTSNLARGINVAYDWGLEVATLSEVYHRLIQRKVAQIDLCPNYEHKHQELSPEDKSRGLHRMVVDIAKFYLTYMRSHGIPLDDAFVDMMLHTYFQNALDFVKAYSDDAQANDLCFDRHEEELTVQYFRGFLWTAWEQSKGPYESSLIPSWNRVHYSVPDIFPRLLEAVEADNA